MQVKRDQIIKYCEDYLKVKDFEDYCVNGLQVEGDEKVGKVITGVSLSQKLIETAIERKAKMIIVHHGIFKDMIGSPAQIKGVMKNRLKLLLENNISLVGFHLPLDTHPEIGNNISLCNLLKLKSCEPFDVGFIGELNKQEKINHFIEKVNFLLDVKSYVIKAGPRIVKKVVISSGGASPKYEIAKEAGADVFICGDVRENIVRGVEEVGINFINAGHYNTEKLGIQNLGKLIAKKFKIKVEFVDVPCDV